MIEAQAYPTSMRADAAAALAQLILERCEQAALPPGSRLPTERTLAGELGVSRAAIRNALGLLEADGRVSREVGRGTFLRTVSRGATVDRSPPTSPEAVPDDVGPVDVMAARQLIEPRVLPLVVACATTRDFDELERCLAGGERAERAEEFEAWDFALHHAIVAASHNALLVRMYAQIEEARKGALWGNMKRRNDTRDRRAGYQRDHREIVDALRARELDHAVEAMTRHLEQVRANLLHGPA